jgi:hypothetical protein
MQTFERRNLIPTRAAPGSPEIDKHNLALEIAQRDVPIILE